MVAVRSVDTIADKFVEKASAASGDYESGVRNPKESWASEAKAAEPAFEAGIRAAISRKAFGKGVSAAGDEKWQTRAVAVGPGRFSEGVGQARDAYAQGMGPVVSKIQATTLPARGARGDPKNIERVRKMAAALASLRTGKGGS